MLCIVFNYEAGICEYCKSVSPSAGTRSGLTVTGCSSGWICSSSCRGCRSPKDVTLQWTLGKRRSLPGPTEAAPAGAEVSWTWAWPWTVSGTGRRSAARLAAFSSPRRRSWSSITEREETVGKTCTFTPESIINLSKDVKYVCICCCK